VGLLRPGRLRRLELRGEAGVAEKDLARTSGRGKRARPSDHLADPSFTFGGPSGSGDIGAGEAAGNNAASGTGGSAPSAADLGDVTALAVDPSITFDAVGGLPSHLLTLRECVLVPLLYPALMERLQLRPPRGMLFVGPPGTGKTLVARALANEGRRNGRNITFFMRKGADILSKWVGESERQLRLLFDEARRRQPSVIFFDEIDGLAPVRHSKQEQSHAALVSTLLALLDGLDDRGQVIVIGATNRVDTVDPALRRPGRFDRELFFPLPDAPGRRHILSILLRKYKLDNDPHINPQPVTTTAATKNTVAASSPAEAAAATPVNFGRSPRSAQPALPPPAAITSSSVVAESGRDFHRVVERLVAETHGFSGADLAALATEAALCALRRAVPQIYATSDRLVLPPNAEEGPRVEDFLLALRRVQPSLQRAAAAQDAGRLDPVTEDLHASVRDSVTEKVATAWFPVATALRARREATDDMALAAARLSRVPPMSLPCQVCLPFVPAAADATAVALAASASGAAQQALGHGWSRALTEPTVDDAADAALAVAQGLPTLPLRVLHLPLVADASLMQHGHGAEQPSSLAEFDGMPGGGSSGFGPAGGLMGFCTAVARCAPCFVLVRGFDDWVDAKPDAAAVAFVRYAFSTLTSTDVAFLVPCLGAASSLAALRAVFPASVVRAPVRVGGPTVHDLRCVLTRTASRMVDSVLGGAGDPAKWAVLQVDKTQPKLRREKPRRTPAQKAASQQRWSRVLYKRTQLRHILRSWLMTFVESKIYSVFCDRDLDLTDEKDGNDLQLWRKHTRGRRIGLLDILEKLDNSEYTCLSQYNDDIDTLHGNVIGFFNHRDPRGLRYRTRATQLRDATILNNHKIHPNLIAFTEETKEEDEPVDSSSDEDAENEEEEEDANESEENEAVTGGSSAVRARPKPKRRRRFYSTPRKRRPNAKPSTQKKESESDEGEVQQVKNVCQGEATERRSSQGETPQTLFVGGESSPLPAAPRTAEGRPADASPPAIVAAAAHRQAFASVAEAVDALLAEATALLHGRQTASTAVALPFGASSFRRVLADSLVAWALLADELSAIQTSEAAVVARAHRTLHAALFAAPIDTR
jgi:SpoVK/Ycf46/Vps4 family AAA+-type ATPase